MKHAFHLVWLAPALLASGVAMAGDTLPSADNPPLRPVSKCLDAGSINEWHVINDTTITARNGPRYYVIKTAHKCPRLDQFAAGLFFRPSNGKGGAFRICGDIGETVSSRAQPPCAIKSVKLVSEDRFNALNEQQRRNARGSNQH